MEDTIKTTDDIQTEEFFLNMGPQHPSTHGLLRVELKLDGERVVEAIPHVGYLHRSIEKMAEGKTFTQFIPLTDRVDYVTSMTCNLVFVLAAEKILDLVLTPRGEYIRVLMSEFNRIASHLVWFGTMALDVGATTPFLWAFRDREKICDIFEMTCGQRLTYNYLRVGGSSHDLPEGFVEAARDFIKYFRPILKEYDEILTGNIIFLKRAKEVGAIPADMAINYGLTGPNLRASGVKFDVRKDDPYLNYPEFDFDIPTGTIGDIWDRYYVRVEEMRQSLRIIEQALDKLSKGPWNVNIPTDPYIKPDLNAVRQNLLDRAYGLNMHVGFKVPPGEAYARIEAPRGDVGCFLVTNGTSKAYRCKFRTGSFSNLCIAPAILPGTFVADVVAILASLDFVLPEVDR